MLDFTEQAVSTTSLPELSLDTPIVSDSHLDTNALMASIPHFEDVVDSLADPAVTAATITKLTPFRPGLIDMIATGENGKSMFTQDETDSTEV